MDWCDAHCHLTDARISLENVLAECRGVGITRFVLGGIDPCEWDKQDELDRRHPGTFIKVFGVHPWRVDELAARGPLGIEALNTELGNLATRIGGASGLGEAGLDAARGRFERSRQAQLDAFERQLDLAHGCAKPVVLHVVRAHREALSLLTDRRERLHGGLVHSFSGTWADGRRYLDLGFTLSISARVTYPDASDLREIVAKAPASGLVFETDAPSQPPYGCGDKLHTPLSLFKVVRLVSDIRKDTDAMSPEALLDRSRETLGRLFKF